jgi:tRNA(Ile)-lysidine synthase
MVSGAALGAEIEVARIDVAAYRRSLPGWSVQQAARAARYHALARVAQRRGAAAIVVAHTADDQAETLLLNLLRGTGLNGFAAMRMDETLDLVRLGPKPAELAAGNDHARVARPLLGVARSTTLAYCAEFGLSIVEDASNKSRTFTRNRVRLDLLPALEQFNPAVRGVLARAASLAAEDVAALDVIVAALDARLRRSTGPGFVAYDLDLWRGEPRALRRRLLRGALALLLGGLEDVPTAPIEDALDLLQSGSVSQTYHLPYGVELRIGSDDFVLRRHGRALHRKPPPRGPSKNWGSEVSRV